MLHDLGSAMPHTFKPKQKKLHFKKSGKKEYKYKKTGPTNLTDEQVREFDKKFME